MGQDATAGSFLVARGALGRLLGQLTALLRTLLLRQSR